MKQPYDPRNKSKHYRISNSSTTSLSAKQISNSVKLNHSDHPNGTNSKSISPNEGLYSFKRSFKFGYNNPKQVTTNKMSGKRENV